ncbi:homoaconitase [Capronia epimyces CBS 606.96]|uniref:Homoaconitase, mitochondrial n=1 Tax=Capronia epimyces CBS 606.96 TaxID=1182542 RepID=W9XUM6_9EURO|nr:homoaconitase [Capronia epimyces CBS 606.96]EXJ80711.1 homoaconitase [Capronia epimyces CBS 606.96]
MTDRAVDNILPLFSLERFYIWQTLISLTQVAAATLARSLIRASLGRSLKRSRHNQPSCRYASTTVSAFGTNSEGPVLPNIVPGKKVTSPQTLTEKILQRHSVDLPQGKVVRSGDYVQIQPHRCMTHDNTWPVAMRFMSTGATKIKDPDQLVFALDHDVQNKSASNLKKYEQIQEFAKKHGVEELFVWPGTLCVGSDSHSNMYGALGSLGVALVRTDAAGIFATGKSWFQCPPVVQVNLLGTLPPGVRGKDVIIALCGLFPLDVLNHSVEFVGSEETMASIPMDDRLTISNMSTEWSATSAMFPIDTTLERWLRYKATEAAMLEDRSTRQRITHEMVDELFANPLRADPGAHYAKKLYLNLSTLSPYISGPNSVKISTPLHDLATQNIKIDKGYIVSCTNSRSSDLKAAAEVFQAAAESNGGRIPKIADGVKLYIAAASAREQAIAEDEGSWQTLVEAGATVLPPSCGPCIGLGTGLLEDGETGVSASNRNFKGRLGSRLAHAYLSSPEVVAASALHGVLSGPGVYKVPENYTGVEYGYGTGNPDTIEAKLGSALEQLESLIDRIETTAPVDDDAAQAVTNILPGFPTKISGEIVFADADNLDTDNIYAGKYTYQDHMTTAEMANVCMENYDPEFRSIAKPNDILVSGFNFGCGSSREQAATALLARDIQLVVAGSFSNIFVRNGINNALPCLELPRLVERLRTIFSEKIPTRRTGWTLTWDIARSTIEVQEGEDGERWEEKVGEFPENLQEIIAKGGLVGWVKHELAKAA